MDATYCILWLDDQKDELHGVYKNLEGLLYSVGLNIHVTWVDKFDDASVQELLGKLRNYSPYDLIMVDYDLGADKGKFGHTLTRRIRNHTYGDMAFYSSASDDILRKKLYEEKVDGVYCMQRDSLAHEVFALAQNAIRRVIHPNYMRGLVVGSVGELDGLFGDTICTIIKRKGSPSIDEVREMAKSSLQGYIDELQRVNIPRFDNLPLERVIGKLNLHVKVQFLLKLLDEDGASVSIMGHEVISRFAEEINEQRIEFAHARTTNIEGIPVFKDRNKKVWKPEDMRNFLLKLRAHYEAAKNVHGYFNRQ